MDPVRYLIALAWAIALALIWVIYGPQRSFESTWSPRTRMLVLGLISAASNLTVSAILNFFGFLVKWTSSYFFGANDTPCVFA